MKLNPRSIDRLVKLLGMLGSSHDGERAVAALKANALVREHGLVWADVIPTTPEQRSYRQEQRWNDDTGAKKQNDQQVDWRDMRNFCAQRSHLLRSREQEFIDDI